MVKKTALKNLLWLGVSFVFFASTPVFASAANVSFFPSAGDYEVGNTFSVKVLVASPDQSINAVSGAISFSKDTLEVVSLVKSGSIFNFWVQEPSFSNTDGTVNFEGIILSPGFISESGKIITINFKVKKAGVAVVNFLSGSVLANDGKGTNVVKSLGTAQFAINPPAPSIQESAPVAKNLASLLAPKVISLTHADPSKWYSNSDITFQWDVPKDTTDVSFVLDVYPQSTTEKLRGVIDHYAYTNIEDGIWYFHIKFKHQSGWGSTTSFRVQIDTQKPFPIILTFPRGATSLDNRPVALFNTTDSLSGIDHYEVRVGDKHSYRLLPDATTSSNPYVIPPQEPGKYSMIVAAYDKAGNFTQANGNFEIIALDLPQIISIPDKMYEGDFFRIIGRSYPKATIVAMLKNNGQEIEEENTFINDLGQFTLTWPTYLKSGQYFITFFVVNENGAKSLQTPEKTLMVEKKYILNLGIVRLTLTMIVWLNVALFFLINALIGYWVYHFSHTKNRFNKKLNAIENQLNELIIYLSTKLTDENFKKAKPRVKTGIAKMKEIISDTHKL